jgi:hypothetical protein
VHELRERLASGCLPVFTSDGLNLYFYALTAHFGQWVAGVSRGARQWLLRGRLNLRPGEEDLSTAEADAGHSGDALWDARCAHQALTGLRLSGRLNTAFVEPLNLTLRQSVAALIRRTWATMQDAPHLLLHLEWWRAYYHFVRPHESLRLTLGQPCARGGKRVPQREKAADAGHGGRADAPALDGA